MMALFALSAVAVGGFILLDDGTSPDDTSTDDADPDEGFEEDGEGRLVGTSGDNSLSLSDVPDANTTSYDIDAGDGDDVLDLLPPGNEAGDPAIYDAPIFGDIDAGAGDDTIRVNVWGPTIDGGAGDDDILVASSSTDGLVVNGGDGDDTIDGSMVDDGRLNGGAGNDLILSSGPLEAGSGYVNVADGGAGEDTIVYDLGSTFDFAVAPGKAVAYGGEGADRFEVQLDEGEVDLPANPDDLDGYLKDDYLDGDTIRGEPLQLPDFEPGSDTLVLEADSVNDDFELSSIRMETLMNRQTGMEDTEVILSYESATQLTREMVVRVGGTGLTWDDVELEGVDRSVLVPLTG